MLFHPYTDWFDKTVSLNHERSSSLHESVLMQSFNPVNISNFDLLVKLGFIESETKQKVEIGLSVM